MNAYFNRLAPLLVLFFIVRVSLAQDRVVTAEQKKQTIDSLAALLPERYTFKELAPKLQQLLQENLKRGKYDSIQSATEFSVAVTADLRSLNSDRHLALSFNPQSAPAVATSSPTVLPPEQRAKQASEFNRQMNYGFKRVEFLNGNIGYLKFDYFDAYLDYSGPIVDASMAYLKNSDALIIDLRDNGGGAGVMVGYIEGFFFSEKTLVGTSYDRLTDTRTESFITPQPKEKQFPKLDIYVLTSSRTVSAAEALAYDLKYLKGAKVIGETSAGAANPGRVTRLNDLFTAFIPNRHGAHVVTGKNWEGTGVPVDIRVEAGDALRVARLEALRTLRNRATTGQQRKKLDTYITYLEKGNIGSKRPAKTLLPYAGEYTGGRAVTFREGKLHYSRIAEASGPMTFISSDVFMLAEGDTTIRFTRNKLGKVSGMAVQWSLSETASVATKLPRRK